MEYPLYFMDFETFNGAYTTDTLSSPPRTPACLGLMSLLVGQTPACLDIQTILGIFAMAVITVYSGSDCRKTNNLGLFPS